MTQPTNLTMRHGAVILAVVLVLFAAGVLLPRILYSPRTEYDAALAEPQPTPTPTPTRTPAPTRTAEEDLYEIRFNKWGMDIELGLSYYMSAYPVMKRTLASEADYEEAIRLWSRGCLALNTTAAPPPLFSGVAAEVKKTCASISEGVSGIRVALRDESAYELVQANSLIEQAAKHKQQAELEYYRANGLLP